MREILKSVFDNDYQGAEHFINNVLKPIFGDDVQVYEFPEENPTNADEETLKKANIEEILRVATIYRDGTSPIEVFDITLAENAHLSRSRVGIQKLIRSALFYNHAFMLFHYRQLNGREWRFSYAYKQGKNADASDAKRYTYLFSRYLHARTAIDRFSVLEKSSKDNEALLEAFNVEALSDDFFGRYRQQYAKFVKFITGKEYIKEGGKYVEKSTGEPNEAMYNEFGRDDKAVRDYVKKMMGRITFLHFIQRKGWMPGADLNYMLHMFRDSKHKDDYLDEVLEPLFFGVLNTKLENRLQSQWGDKLLPEWQNIPYLNGGLFEQDPDDAFRSVFPADYFAELFEFFSEYNFTVDENDPDDAEVGVDPEMLGKIFENLLEDNKDKGAFYTPKEIVRYMCQESLIAYLNSKSNAGEGKIRNFVLHPYDTVNELSNAEQNDLYNHLESVKICDPAIGSGAFPMGLLNELLHCEEALIGEKLDRASIKKQIIQNNIYGVDIEKGAIDIARLRFWLSIVVDEEEASPLPNLDYKIMQGNSLLESYKGVDLSHILDEQEGTLSFGESTKQELGYKLTEYFSCTEHDNKKRLQKEINDLVHQQIIEESGGIKDAEAFKSVDVSANQEFFLWHTWFSDVFNRPSDCDKGFDIVIGNPPYLEARSPEFSDNFKRLLQSNILAHHGKTEAKFFPRGADLLIFFFELSFRIITPDGINVFITENSWLSTDYGKLFQEYLLDNINIHAIIDSDYKYFETADINTVITMFRNKTDPQSDSAIRFYYCHGNLGVHPCNTFSKAPDPMISLKEYLSTDVILEKYKWSLIQKSNPRILDIIDTLTLLESAEISRKISIGQGLNITKDKILTIPSQNASPFFIADNGPQYYWKESNAYVPNNIASSSRKKPILFMPRGIGTHFCCYNWCNGYTSSYVEIYEEQKMSDNEKLNVWLFCNSSLFWLIRELTGRTNLGGGMLKAEATDMKSVPICFDFGVNGSIEDFVADEMRILNTNIGETLSTRLHRRIDDVVLSFMGYKQEEDFITSCLVASIYARTKKKLKNY